MIPYFHIQDPAYPRDALAAPAGTVQVFRPRTRGARVFPRDFTLAFTHPDTSLTDAARASHAGRAGESGDVFLLGEQPYRLAGDLTRPGDG